MSDENPYLELAKDIPDQNTTEDNSDNPYMDLAANLDTMHDQNLKGSTFVAADKDPDQHAKVLTLAEKYGSRSDFIEENYDIVRKQNEKNLLDEQAFASGPKLKSFIANPDNMAVSKDDLDILNKIEGTVDNHSLANDAWKALQVGGLNLNSMLAKTPGYLANALLIPENIYHKYNNEPQKYFKIENDLSKRYDDAAANLSAQIPDLNNSAFEQLGNADFKGAAKTAMLQFVSNAPVQMGLIASMMTGFGEAGLVAAGVTAAAAKGDALQKQGVEPLQGTAVAGVNGLIEASFESIGTMGLLKSWEQSAIKNFGKQGGKEFVLNFGKQLFHTTFGEGTEEAATSFAQDFVDYSTGVNPDAMKGSIERSFNAGLIGGLSGGLMTSPSGFGLSVAKSRQLYQIKQTQAFYEDLGKFATDSKLRVRAPEKFKELVARLTKDGPVEKTYIDQKGFNEYFQSKNINPTEAAIELGITEQYNDAVETGADIEVPTAIMAEKFAPNEHYQGLTDHIKFTPDALTKSQYDAAEAEFSNNIKQEYDAAMATKSEDEVKTFEDSAKEVATNIERQLVEQQLDKSKDAKDKALTISEFFKVMAARSGQMPMDLFNKYGLRINNMQNDLQAGVETKQAVPSLNDLYSQPLPKQNMAPASRDESGNLVLDAANLDALRARIDQSEAGQIIPKLNEAGETVGSLGKDSTFPEFFKNKGYTKKETLNAIDKYKSGKKLTEKQSLLLEDLYNSMADAANRNEYFQNKEKPRMFGSDGSIEGIKKGIEKFYYSKPGTIQLVETSENTWDVHNTKGKIDGVQVVKKGNRFRFEEVKSTEYFQKSNIANPYSSLGMYSKLQQTIDQKMSNSMAVKDLKGLLKEIKPEEMKYLGLDDFLKGKEKVTKAEVQEFLNANNLEIKEVTLSNDAIGDTDGKAFRVWSDGEYMSTHPDYDEAEAEIEKLNEEYPDSDNSIQEVDAAEENQNYNSVAGLPKFETYKTSGGENYREVLFTLPVNNTGILSDISIVKNSENEEWDVLKNGRAIFSGTSESEAIEYRDALANERSSKGEGQYTSSHWNEKNVLAHTRLQDFTDSDGKKVLLVEEIQSDWHQEGRKKGYKDTDVNEAELRLERKKLEDEMSQITESTRLLNKEFMAKAKESSPDDYMKEYKRLTESDKEYNDRFEDNGKKHDEAKAKFDEITNKISLLQKGVPDAPFKKNWHEFVFKRLLREAAEKGYDKIAWTKGEQQNERYDLSKQVKEIKHQKIGDDKYTIDVVTKNGTSMTLPKEEFTASELEDVVGKDVAKKIVDNEGKSYRGRDYKTLEGLDLKIGGEGMKGFYDKILVDFANKFVKKFGAKVGESEIQTQVQKRSSYFVSKNADGAWGVFENLGSGIPEEISLHDSKESANAEKDKLNQNSKSLGEKVHSIDITPELKKQALGEGFTLFQENKGSITFGDDRKFNINLFKGKDASTFFHESGHFFLEVMGDIAQAEGADELSKKDYAATLKWLGVNSRSEITTEHHEKFARGFEAYLYKGEAPNEKLKGVFRKFANWLKLVYKNVAELNVEVSPEMKEVFDRMLAADEQVDKAYAEMEPIQLFADPKSVGMTDAEALEYLNAVEFAKQEAKETLTAQLMKDILRKAESAYKKKYNELYDSEMKKAESMNEFKTIKAIQAEYKLSKPVLERDYEVFKNYLPRGSTQQEGGMHPDMVAGLYGYENGQAMLQAIAPFRKGIEDYVTTNVADTMKSLYPELLTSPELSNEAIKAAHNDNYKKLKRMELDYLFKNDPKVVSTLGAKLIRRMPTDKMIRAVVEKTVGKTKVKDINPRLFKSAERKYALEASKAFKKGEYDLAIEAKRKEYLNSELYRATEKSKEEIEKTVDKFDKIFKSDEAVAKSRDLDLVSAARYIWSTYGLASDKDQEKTATYLDKLKQYQPDLYKRIEPLLVEYTKNKGSYEEMSYDSFIELSKNVQNIWDMSKTSNEIMIEGKAVLKETIVNELIDRSNTLSEGKEMPGYNKAITDGERRGINILGLLARYKKIEHWAYSFDGGALNGPATKYIFRPISEAQTKFELAKIDVTKKLEKIATDYLKNIDNKKSYSAPEIGYTFKNKQELLYAILHTGNESNYEKLLIGGRGNEKPWGYLNADETLNDSQFKGMIDRMIREGSLTRDDFMFAQSIWDLNEQLKPDAQKAHKRIYGFFFNEITAKEFTNDLGTFRGGYVPAIADADLTVDQTAREDKNMLEGFNNSYVFPTTGKGFTNSRVENYHAPLSLDMNKITGHMNHVLRFVYIEPSIKEVGKLLLDKKLLAAIGKVDPKIVGEALIPWLQRTAAQRLVTKGATGLSDKIFSGIRRNSSLQFMAMNVANWFQNTTGLFPVLTRVDSGFVMGSFKDYLLNPKDFKESIIEKSDYMKTRTSETARELAKHYSEVVLETTQYEKVKDAATDFAFFGEKVSNAIIESVAWNAAYRSYITKGESDIEAVKFADATVRQALVDNSAAGSSFFQSGTPFQRLFTMFSGYFFNTGNLALSEWHVAKQLGLTTKAGGSRAAWAYTMIIMAPAVVSALMMRAFAGKGLDGDDDGEYFDDIMDILFYSQMRFLTAMVPGGTVANTAMAQFNDKAYDDRINLSPAVSTVEQSLHSLSSVPKAIGGNGDPARALKDSLTALGLASGLPLGVLNKPISYIDKVEKGKVKPNGPVDYTRGLVTGK